MRDRDEQLKFEGNCSQCGEWSHQKKVHLYKLHHGAAHSLLSLLHQTLATILRFFGRTESVIPFGRDHIF